MGANCVDVRDMVCAQALAVVSRAVTQGAAGQIFSVLMNAEDVRRDVLAWSQHAAVTIQHVEALAQGEQRIMLLKP